MPLVTPVGKQEGPIEKVAHVCQNPGRSAARRGELREFGRCATHSLAGAISQGSQGMAQKCNLGIGWGHQQERTKISAKTLQVQAEI